MATRTLPMLCILFLLFSASLVFPSAEGIRTLEENNDGNGGHYISPLLCSLIKIFIFINKKKLKSSWLFSCLDEI
jgi:hypothetical protein